MPGESPSAHAARTSALRATFVLAKVEHASLARGGQLGGNEGVSWSAEAAVHVPFAAVPRDPGQSITSRSEVISTQVQPVALQTR